MSSSCPIPCSSTYFSPLWRAGLPPLHPCSLTVPPTGPGAQQVRKERQPSKASSPNSCVLPFLQTLNIQHESEETLEASYLPPGPPWPTRSTNEPTDATPGLVSGGGRSSSRSWESLTSSIQRRSRSRRAGSGAEPRAETESQEQPESTSSCRPGQGRRAVGTPSQDRLPPHPVLPCHPALPCRRFRSHMSCFLETPVQLRSRARGWRRTTPLSMGGVRDFRRLRSIRGHRRLS